MLLDFEMALGVAKGTLENETGIKSLAEFFFNPKENEKEMSRNLINSLATGNELMRSTLYKAVIHQINVLNLEKAYMKG